MRAGDELSRLGGNQQQEGADQVRPVLQNASSASRPGWRRCVPSSGLCDSAPPGRNRGRCSSLARLWGPVPGRRCGSGSSTADLGRRVGEDAGQRQMGGHAADVDDRAAALGDHLPAETWQAWNTPRRLIVSTRSHISSVWSRKSVPSFTPAQFTRMSARPARSSVTANRFSMDCRDVTSTST